VILVLADNLGWGELGCYGGGALRGAPTPRIDALAAEGLRLLNFNVESDCVPTRSALMTGRHPIRTGALQSVPAGLPQGLIPWEITLAQLFKQQGYATAIHGKWHLGDRKGRFPTDRGFDEWYGIPRTTNESMFTSSADVRRFSCAIDAVHYRRFRITIFPAKPAPAILPTRCRDGSRRTVAGYR
jgi:arylsulfatase